MHNNTFSKQLECKYLTDLKLLSVLINGHKFRHFPFTNSYYIPSSSTHDMFFILPGNLLINTGLFPPLSVRLY